MVTLVNRAKVATATTGTGTITLGSAESGYQTFGDAGVANADVVRYVIEDGTAWEIGTGTYTATGTTLTRTVSESSNADAAIVLTGSATVFIGATAEDIPALYAENRTGQFSYTAPSATGDNSVAIGNEAVASGSNNSTAIGWRSTASASAAFSVNSTVSGSQSIGMGYLGSVTAGQAVGIGLSVNVGATSSTGIGRYATTASGQQSMALGKSYASGTDSLAAAIADNTSTYGATGANSVAIGKQAKATNEGSLAFGHTTTSTGQFALALGYQSTAGGTQSVAIGRSNQTGGNFALALGYASNASASNSVAIGDSNTASHANAIAIGDSVQSTAINQVSIGGTADTVRISESYTLPTADGTANQVLTTDGSGAVTFADAGGGGGADLYVANESSPAAQPTAAGANAIGIGDTAQAAGADGVAIGLQSYARAQSALGLFGDAQNTESICIGKGSAVTADGGVQLGRNGYATAVDAVSLGKSRASGASSFAAAINNNTSSYGASGANSVAIGSQARAYSTGSQAIGNSAFASGTSALSLGNASSASGTKSIAIGNSTATAYLASSFGEYALSESQGKYSYASGRFGSTEGSAQTGTYVLRADTTDATPEGLTTRNNGGVQSDNQVNLPNNSAYGFTGTIIAREDSAATNDFAVWEVKGGAVRAASAATTALGSYNINKISESTGAATWAIAISADTTNGAIAFTVTGEASHSIRWVATINTTEVIY